MFLIVHSNPFTTVTGRPPPETQKLCTGTNWVGSLKLCPANFSGKCYFFMTAAFPVLTKTGCEKSVGITFACGCKKVVSECFGTYVRFCSVNTNCPAKPVEYRFNEVIGQQRNKGTQHTQQRVSVIIMTAPARPAPRALADIKSVRGMPAQGKKNPPGEMPGGYPSSGLLQPCQAGFRPLP